MLIAAHEIKRHLLLGRKVMINLDSILNSRDITLPTKVRLVKAMVFLAVIYGCWELDHEEGWLPKNWCFWTVVLEKTLVSPLVNPKGNQSWMFIRRTDAEAETPELWLPDAQPTHWKRPWCRERLRAEGEGGNKGWDDWMASSTQWTWVWASSRRWGRTRKPGVLQFTWSQRVRHDWATEQQQNTALCCLLIFSLMSNFSFWLDCI